MSVSNRSPVAVLRALVTQIQEKQITFIAASLAYYAFISLIPLLLFVLFAVSVIGGEALTNTVVSVASGALSSAGQEQLVETLTNESGASSAISIGLLVLLWSAIKVFRGMDVAFSEVYGDPGPEGIVEQVKDAVITLSGVIAAIVITVVIGGVVSFVQSSGVLTAIGLGFLQGIFGPIATLVSILGLAIALFPLYYFLPADGVTVREAIPGALFTAVGWTAFQTAFRLYAGGSGDSAYGVIGGAIALVTFLYFGAMILLVGVALNFVLAGRATAEEYGDDEDAGETNRTEGVFRSRVKERTQAILDERDAEREAERDGDRAITDGGRAVAGRRAVDPDADRDRATNEGRRLMTDGGVEADRTEASETGPETGDGEGTGTAGTVASAETNAGPTGPEAATATGLDGREYTLSEEYALQREIERLRAELDAFEMEVEERVVDRDALESDLKSYVRERVRSGKARGWGPYLVLLYGTAMTIAIALGDALTGGWAVLAILIIFLSTLGLYVVMVAVGLGLSALSIPGKLRSVVGSLRS